MIQLLQDINGMEQTCLPDLLKLGHMMRDRLRQRVAWDSYGYWAQVIDDDDDDDDMMMIVVVVSNITIMKYQIV